MSRKPPGTPGITLFEAAARQTTAGDRPLADRVRPRQLSELLGHADLLGPGTSLRRAIEADRVPSMILWGPPGCGKTTIAHVISHLTKSEFVPFSAVLGGIPELRVIIADAQERRSFKGRRTILFVDEIHRFNKAQQDAFLPHVEAGTVTLIGATTENPSFSVNAAVLSRCQVVRLGALAKRDLVLVLRRAMTDTQHGLAGLNVSADDAALELIAEQARGDARRALGLLEAAAAFAGALGPSPRITTDIVEQAQTGDTLLYDKSGEEHYNVVSAFIKSMRGSDPDAAVYWLMRMLDAGEDPLFVARRLMIFASEDVGNADPRALAVAVNADAAFRRMGMPEGLYPLAHACLYLASCPKSNAVGKAFTRAREAIAASGALPVPDKLRNAVTALMKEQGYGGGYKYPHDFQDGFAPEEEYLPQGLEGSRFYEPTNQGLEASIAERLARLRPRRGPKG